MTADQRRKGFDAVHDALQIDVDDPVPVALADRADLPAYRHARIVADEVHLAEAGDGFEGGRAHRASFAHVAAHRMGLDLLAGKAFSRVAGGVKIDVREHDVHARPAERARHGKPDAGRSPGDKGRLAFEVLH
jgi:hypothetical protein